MTILRVESLVSSDDLLKAVGQLNMPELERFTSEVIALQAQKKAPSLPRSESELVLKINQGLPEKFKRRYDELIEKRRAETLSQKEYKELLRMTQETEKFEAQRVECLAQLAKTRKTTLSVLMKSLGLQNPKYA
jgi:small-conductance mechanosensitive channel